MVHHTQGRFTLCQTIRTIGLLNILLRLTCSIAALTLLASRSTADDATNKPTFSPSAIEQFEKKIRPLFVEHCLKCHGSEPTKIKAGLKMTSREDLLKGGDTGPAIQPGKQAKSLLMEVLRYEGETKMPPKGKLKAAEIAAIAEWIEAGAAWPEDKSVAANITNKALGVAFTEEQKKFWAFQPIQMPTPPEVKKDKGRVVNPIDAFIIAKLEGAGLDLAPMADKRTLIRRVTFDITGLPPTPEEVETFEKDNSADAYRTVVDRLLNSPAYGERWGRHWLDAARYADSNGLDENTAFANAWKYRDYVIRSFNADKPYDLFLQEQIAGDLLPASNDPKIQGDRYTALGYLVLGPKVLAEPDKQKMLIDIADEQLDTLGKGLMGLTLGCARCHDHKFDPLPTRDYYSLLGIFTSTRTMKGLGTVAQAFERSLSPPEKPEITEARKSLTKKNKELQSTEKKLAKIDEKETDKRKEAGEKIAKLKAEISSLEELALDVKLERIRKELEGIEEKFGKTPEKEKAKRQELHREAEKRRAEIKLVESKIVPPDLVLSVEEGSAGAYETQPRNLFVQIRGNYLAPGEEAPPIFLRIIAGETPSFFVSTDPKNVPKPEPAKTRFGAKRTSSGRLEFARWLTDPKNPLTARVFVNRIWQHHFGEGIVRSVDNFGRLGERPSHPELLDWLAAEFVEKGWSIKNLQRTILLSATYRQAGRENAAAALKDPDNRLLWRFPRQRLEAEAIRDTILAVASTLDRSLGGTLMTTNNFDYVTNDQSGSNESYNSTRRSIYLPVVRNNVFPFFQTFDFPDPSMMAGKRVSTVVAPQALYLMNSSFVAAQSKAFAERLEKAEPKDESARVALAYRLAFSRPATQEEVTRAVQFIGDYKKTLGSEKDAAKKSASAWQAFAQALFASNEFVFVE